MCFSINYAPTAYHFQTARYVNISGDATNNTIQTICLAWQKDLVKNVRHEGHAREPSRMNDT